MWLRAEVERLCCLRCQATVSGVLRTKRATYSEGDSAPLTGLDGALRPIGVEFGGASFDGPGR
jgi:hypothetical protein